MFGSGWEGEPAGPRGTTAGATAVGIAGAWTSAVAAALLAVSGATAQEPAPAPADSVDRVAPSEAGAGVPIGAATPSGELDREALLGLWSRSYYPGRSGDILLVLEPDRMVTAPGVPFMHGSPWDHDARVPLILYGPAHVRQGVYEAAAGHQDIGATLERLLGLPRRPTTTGRALSEALVGGRAPRVIVVLVLDGFRPDYLERYAEETPTLGDLAARGAWFPRARAAALPTATAVAHATLMTGSDPALHGITGNSLYDPVRGSSASAYEGASAKNVMVLTLADRWSAATGGRAVIAAQGGTFYPAVALAGHGACTFGGRPVIVAFFGSSTGGWGTNSECYTLPDYLRDDDIRTLLATAAAEEGGEAASPSGARSLAHVFPRFEGDATVEILEGEPFGEDEVTDLLLVNHKATDYIGHAHGPGSDQTRTAVAEVDRQVARIVTALEAKAGPEGFILVLTADHGMPDEPGEEGRHGHEEIAAALNARFDPQGTGIVLHYEGADNQLYVDRARLAELGVATAEVAAFLEGLPWFRHAFTEAEVAAAAARAAAAGPEPRREGAGPTGSEP